ncbi:ComF family protein, partial [Candidatus Desantisbacteria bacterium]|nr:ComF family protein [Candidatus Desantisbacteria bacterium]
DIKYKTVLLIDDVTTTGSTINECSKVLIKGGCKEVYVLVFAKTILN